MIAAALVYQVVARVPTDALNVALGVACGVAATIPVTVGLALALLRQRHQAEHVSEWNDPEPTPGIQFSQPMPRPTAQPTFQQPQIIVLAPQGQTPLASGQTPQNLYQLFPWLTGAYDPAGEEPDQAVDARDWRIIGE